MWFVPASLCIIDGVLISIHLTSCPLVQNKKHTKLIKKKKHFQVYKFAEVLVKVKHQRRMNFLGGWLGTGDQTLGLGLAGHIFYHLS